MKNQRDDSKHSYAVVDDQRFPHDERMVPIIAARHARPVVTDDWTYRCTPYAAMTITWQQAFKKMRIKALPKISVDEAQASHLTTDCFSLAVGSGYTSPATMLGLSGTGTFKAPMLMEKRDLLIAAAEVSGEHAYAEYNIELYEADPPNELVQSDLRQIRFNYQQQIADYNKHRLQGILVDITNGINGMTLYKRKFPLMILDDEDRFRKLLQETLKKSYGNYTASGVALPSIRREHTPDDDGEEIVTLSREAFEDDWTGPRNEFEAQQSHHQREQARLEYPEERAPFQYALQKKTSEVTLTTPPVIRQMSELQIQTSRSRAERERENQAELRGEDSRKRFAILNETEDLMRAQLKKGRFYSVLTEVQKKDFDSILEKSPPREQVTWLVRKLQSTVREYPQFVELMTFCHVQKEGDDGFKFVINYVHQNYILPELRQLRDQEWVEKIKSFYRRFYEGDGLLDVFVNEKIKTSLEYAGYYPEPPPSEYK